jgi:hypothetical protein
LLSIKQELENLIIELFLNFKEDLLIVHPLNRRIVVRISLNLIRFLILKEDKAVLVNKLTPNIINSLEKVVIIKMNPYSMAKISYNSKDKCIHNKNGLNSDFFLFTLLFLFIHSFPTNIYFNIFVKRILKYFYSRFKTKEKNNIK